MPAPMNPQGCGRAVCARRVARDPDGDHPMVCNAAHAGPDKLPCPRASGLIYDPGTLSPDRNSHPRLPTPVVRGQTVARRHSFINRRPMTERTTDDQLHSRP